MELHNILRSSIMIQQRLVHLCAQKPLISISQFSFSVGWEWKDVDLFDIIANPGTMNWTVTKEDTGDGTDWITTVPTDGTGSYYNAIMSAAEDNDTGFMRSMDIRFSDDAAGADDVVVPCTQDANPV